MKKISLFDATFYVAAFLAALYVIGVVIYSNQTGDVDLPRWMHTTGKVFCCVVVVGLTAALIHHKSK